MSPPLTPPGPVLAAALSHLVRCYPEEGCGLILRRGDEWRFEPMRNAVTRFHRADPESFPFDARRAYLFDPEEQRHVFTRAEKLGWSLIHIVHSHCDEAPIFSDLDREMAMATPTEPLHPGVAYLVVEVRRGKAEKACLYAWTRAKWSGHELSI